MVIPINNSGTISPGQLTALVTVPSITMLITCNASVLGGNHLTDNFLSCGIALIGNFLFLLPIFFLLRQEKDRNLLSQAASHSFGLCCGIAGLEILYLLAIDLQYCVVFSFFLSNAFSSSIPIWLFLGMLFFSAVYASNRGLEAMGRTAVLLLVFLLLGLFLLGILLLQKLNWDYFEPLCYTGPQQALSGSLFFLSSHSSLPAFALLYPNSTKHPRRSFCLWWGITGCVSAGILFLLIGSLGSYANLQLFPFYTASTIAQLGSFQRMDLLFLGIWIVGLFLKLALDFYLITLCWQAIFPSKPIRWVRPAAALLVAIGTLWITSQRDWLEFFLNPYVWFPLTVCIAVLPLLVIFCSIRKDRRKNHAV